MPDSKDPGSRRPGPGFGSGGPGAPRPRVSPWILIAVLVLGLLVFEQWARSSTENPSFGQFQQALDAGQIPKGSTVEISDTSIKWTQKDASGASVTHSAALSANFQTQDLVSELHDKGINVKFVGTSIWVQLLVNVVPILLVMLLLYWFIFRRMAGGASSALNLGRNKVKIYDRKEMKTSFNDVAGVDEAKEELKEIVEFLRNPKKYQRLGGRIPKGVLRRTCPSSS